VDAACSRRRRHCEQRRDVASFDPIDDRQGSECVGELAERRRFGSVAVCDHGLIQRFIITIEGPGWSDFEEIELPRLPSEGDPVDTKFGTLLVERAEPTPGSEYDGKIVCRMP
jgi:hypothetical protein